MDEKPTSEGHDPASASGSASRDLDSIQENAPQSTNVADHNDPTLDRSGSPSETANEPQVTLPSEQDTTSPPLQYFEDAEYFEHVQFFKDVRQNTWILADRGYSGCLDGPSAVGTSGIASCVGMYVEPRPDEFFLWHIQCDPLRKERDNNQKLRNSERRLVARRFQEVLGEYIEGEIDVDLVKSTLVLTSSCPDDQSYAIVDGVLAWAGFGAEQAERWKEGQYGDASAFIVKTPGSEAWRRVVWFMWTGKILVMRLVSKSG